MGGLFAFSIVVISPDTIIFVYYQIAPKANLN